MVLFFVVVLFFLVIAGKLVWLQVVHTDDYRRLAEEQNSRGVVLPARRGVIYAKDYRTNELFPLAQNSTTYTIFADPLLLEAGTESRVADMLAPLLYVPTEEEQVAAADAAKRPMGPNLPPSPSAQAALLSTTGLATGQQHTLDFSENAEAPLEPTTLAVDPRVVFATRLAEKLITKDVVRRVIPVVAADARALVAEARLPGITVDDVAGTLAINPMLIDNPDLVAKSLATIIEQKYDDLYPLLLRKRVRYVKLAAAVPSSAKDAVLKLGIRGVGAVPEYRRIYPEQRLAAQIVGFLNHDSVGAYGIEGSEQRVLAGVNGLRRTQVDPLNRQITVGDITIKEAVDGASVVLTIDRAIQEMAERALADSVDRQRADSGQVIVMDPQTGAILALAHYPTFDPNAYGDVFEREELLKTEKHVLRATADGQVTEAVEEEWHTAAGERVVTEFFRDYIIRNGYRYPVFTEGDKRVIYANRLGPNVFALKAITDPYEPGSVFKPIVMSMALDAGEVTPTTRSPYSAPVDIDEKRVDGKPILIRNALGHYFGRETMTEVIAHSSNIGMTFVVQKLGAPTFYDYLKKFGFGERTDIEFDGEDAGQFENYTKWTKSEMITKGFGQGITVNLIQMATAYSALANGGLLMKPYVIDEEIYPDGRRVKTEPETVRRVITDDTSATITGIMIYSVDQGFAKIGKVEGYYVGGKTGTSQTYAHGKALTEVGTTIATFGGYAPATNAKFVIISKVDRPRVSEWGEGAAGPVFQQVAEELLRNYFAIPPEKK